MGYIGICNHINKPHFKKPMDFDFNAPPQQAPDDPFAQQQQNHEQAPKKKRSKCNLEHVVVYSFFIILKVASPLLVMIILANTVNMVSALPPATLLSVMDEWFTHHIAGRRMVRLRYHIYGVDGKSYVHHEFDTQKKANKCEAITFWAFIWSLPFFWILTLVLASINSVFSFNPMVLAYSIVQGIFSCVTLYRFMMTRSMRTAKIRAEKKEAKSGNPISAALNNVVAPSQAQESGQFMF